MGSMTYGYCETKTETRIDRNYYLVTTVADRFATTTNTESITHAIERTMVDRLMSYTVLACPTLDKTTIMLDVMTKILKILISNYS